MHCAEEAKKAETAEEKERLKERQALLLEYSKSKVKIFKDYNELLKVPGIDAVSICTPPFVHAPITMAAAEAGKHVYCEKPMSRTATEAKIMCEACNKAGVKLGYQSGGTRLGAVNSAIRDYVTSGKLGDVYYGRQTSFRVRGRPGLDMVNFSKWFLDSTKGGGGGLYVRARLRRPIALRANWLTMLQPIAESGRITPRHREHRTVCRLAVGAGYRVAVAARAAASRDGHFRGVI